MNKNRSSAGAKRPQAVSTDFDDWETDPDYVKDMDEMDQRWGSRRTVGSINMNELIDQVNREHKVMRDRFRHPSQKLETFVPESKTRDASESVKGFEERMSKHSSTQEISRKVYTSTSGSESGIRDGSSPFSESTIDSKRVYSGKSTPDKPKIASKPDFTSRWGPESPYLNRDKFTNIEPRDFKTSEKVVKTETSTSPIKDSTTTTTKSIFKEEKSSVTSSRDKLDGSSAPQVFKSIQDKIDAFKKEFEDIESKVSRKSDISKVIKKTSNYETKSSNDLNYVPRNFEGQTLRSSATPTGSSNVKQLSTENIYRPSSASPSGGRNVQSSKQTLSSSDNLPRTDIKGLSKRFESLCRESEDEFKRRTEARRREFFDEIKNQVRETRKFLDGFDPVEDEIDSNVRPKVYTRSETTKEEVVSKIVKEGNKIIQNDTKRNVERSSSCHGSSDDENDGKGTTDIKYISQQLSKSPTEQLRTRSPVDEIKLRVPVVDPEIKGAGLMARTIYEYTAREGDELSFEVDELITNIEKVSTDWYKGTMVTGGRRVSGLFPANYVKLLNDHGEY